MIFLADKAEKKNLLVQKILWPIKFHSFSSWNRIIQKNVGHIMWHLKLDIQTSSYYKIYLWDTKDKRQHCTDVTLVSPETLFAA